MAKKKKVSVTPDYTKEDLKELATFLGSLKQTLQDNNKGEMWESFETLTKFLSATYFEPMLFESWCEFENPWAEVLLYNYEDLPLLVHGDNELRDTLLAWRLQRGK